MGLKQESCTHGIIYTCKEMFAFLRSCCRIPIVSLALCMNIKGRLYCHGNRIPTLIIGRFNLSFVGLRLNSQSSVRVSRCIMEQLHSFPDSFVATCTTKPLRADLQRINTKGNNSLPVSDLPLFNSSIVGGINNAVLY